MAGCCHEKQMRPPLKHLFQEANTIEFSRDPDICEEDLNVGSFLEKIQSIIRTLGLIDQKPFILEVGGNNMPDQRLVFNDQNAVLCHCARFLC